MSDAKYFVLKLNLNPSNNEEGEKNIWFDGYMNCEDRFYISDSIDLPDITPTEVKDATGEFLLVRQHVNPYGEKSFEITTDLFGFYSCFYFQRDGELYLSNSFKALRIYLEKQLGLTCNLNKEYLVPLLISRYTLFSYPYALQTALKEIKILPANKNMMISASAGMEFVDKFEIDDDKPYEELLVEGLQSCKKRLAAFQNFFKSNFKKLYMSGGKDSRATLAVLLSALSNRDLFLHSNNPARMNKDVRAHMQQDLTIANKIALLLGLQVCSKEPVLDLSQNAVGFHESLEDWQNDFSNVRFNFTPSFYTYEYEGSNLKIQFRGAGGEIYRAYWSKVIRGFETLSKRIKNTESEVSNDCSLVFNSLVQSGIVDSDLYSSARDIFVDIVKEMPGKNFDQKIDQHYNFLRHRFHFAHGIRGLNTGELMYLPLIDRRLYLASRKLNDADKASGKMVFDIVDRTNPYLNLIEYDSSVWDESMLERSRTLKSSVHIKLPNFVMGDQHKPAMITADCDVQDEVVSDNAHVENAKLYDRTLALKQRLADNLIYLKSHSDTKVLFNDRLLSLWDDRIKKNYSINMLVGKTESIRDAIDNIKIVYRSFEF